MNRKPLACIGTKGSFSYANYANGFAATHTLDISIKERSLDDMLACTMRLNTNGIAILSLSALITYRSKLKAKLQHEKITETLGKF